jgi:dTMP kinase
MSGLASSLARGRFITFEGGEGSGKSTQIALLAERLRAVGIEVIVTREPGGSPMGERIRALLLDPDASFDAVTQAFLFSAARRDHVVKLIAPALARGAVVISDRFADSTRAYQQAAGDAPDALIGSITAAAVGTTVPDLTVLLDIDPAVGAARAERRRGATARADHFEASALDFHARVRTGYLRLAAREPKRFALIDAGRSPEAVAADVADAVASRLGLPAREPTRA